MYPEEYNNWLKIKAAYESNLKNGIGHAESIQIILNKIDKKLNGTRVLGNGWFKVCEKSGENVLQS